LRPRQRSSAGHGDRAGARPSIVRSIGRARRIAFASIVWADPAESESDLRSATEGDPKRAPAHRAKQNHRVPKGPVLQTPLSGSREAVSLEFIAMFDFSMNEEIQFPIDLTSTLPSGSNRRLEISPDDRRSAVEAALMREREQRRGAAQAAAARRRERRRSRRRSSSATDGAPADASAMALTPVVGSDPSVEQLRFDLACTSFGLGGGALLSGKAGGVIGAVAALIWGRRRWSSHR
jgi:hypothetical protein